MWYPNKLQWRVIWTMAAGFTLLTMPDIVYGHIGLLWLALLIDGVLLIWRLQKTK